MMYGDLVFGFLGTKLDIIIFLSEECVHEYLHPFLICPIKTRTLALSKVILRD